MYDHTQNRRSNFDDVGDFHEKFGLDNTTHHDIGPRQVDSDLVLFRVKFMLEELQEFCAATGITLNHDGEQILLGWDPSVKYNAADAFDALLDLSYVVLGTAHFFGYPWQAGWRLVQRANMSKVRAQSDGSDSKRGSSFDVVKPPGFLPPNIARLLGRFGWDDYKDVQ